ncbi:MAG: hypothetical protein QNJ32_15275 [Xenococcaceae cyanobacterium MO_167.B27]|nr:hypothetical protein [Xenococcaceae cyanobacterium MO_167.B27]
MVEIKFDYRFASEEFFTEEAKEALETAAEIWSDLLQDDFENIPIGAEFTIQNPVTGASELITLEEEIDDILIFVGATDNPFGGNGEGTTSLMGGDTHLAGCCCDYCHTHSHDNGDLSQPGILNASGDIGLLAQAKVDGTDLQGDIFQRRISSDFRDTGVVTDFEPWAGVISFSTSLPQDGEWDFSLNNPDPNKFDFITVALHEMGHILGIGTAPAFTNLAEDGLFNGFNAKNINNNNGIPLESDLGHVEDEFDGNDVLLDPVLPQGRVGPSDIDLAILADIGYEIPNFTKQGSVPELATEGDETIVGAILSDVIDGLAGNDQIQGQEGDDTIKAGAGDDTVFGDVGRDHILGDEGNDNIFGNEQEDSLEGGAGDDTLSGQLGSDSLLGNSGNDSLLGGSGNDTIRGNEDDDLVFGQDGDDVLFGNIGEDELQGGLGNDSLRGGFGNDALFGEDDDDTLEGGGGDDTLIGGAGSDRFDLELNFGNDTITDYIVSEDSISVSAKYDFQTQSYDLTDASQVLEAITNSGDVSNTDQIFTEITLREDNTVTIFHDSELTTDEIEIYFPFQSLFQVTSNGFKIQFSESLDTSVLNLYEQDDTEALDSDLSFTRNSTEENVDGSLVWNESDRTLTFIKTDGILEEDTYTLQLFSRQNGFVSTEGKLLDGDSDGIEGDNFVTEFEVNNSQQRVLSIEDISRGIGQEITNPNTNEGLIISLDDGAEVTQVGFTLTYDPEVLNLNDIVLDSDLGDDWTITTKNLDTPGTAIVSLQGTNALNSGAIDLLQLQGEVSTTAEYGTSHLLNLEDISLNQGGINALGDDALLQVANLGDVDGDGSYSDVDTYHISKIATGITEGFDSFSITDPQIIGDINRDGVVSAFDAYLVSQQVNGVDTDFIL